MKRVTKKLVREALASFTGWNFCYDFKEKQLLTLSFYAKPDNMVRALAEKGITVTEQVPLKDYRTGTMTLAMQE